MNVTVTPMRKRPTTLESITNNNGMRANSPTAYSPVESISLNAFKLNFKPEVPKALRKFTTPNRPTMQPWGKVGSLPGEPPKRRKTRKAGKSRKSRRN